MPLKWIGKFGLRKFQGLQNAKSNEIKLLAGDIMLSTLKPVTKYSNGACALALSLTVTLCLGLAACTTTALSIDPALASKAPSTNPAEVGEYIPLSGYLRGYLSLGEQPNSLTLLPPPPAEDSPAHLADKAQFEAGKVLRQGVRGQIAFDDNNLKFPAAASVFSCALNVPISEESTPHINMLLRRTLVDAGLATYKAKNHYQRTRPFVSFKEKTCAPQEDAKLSKDGAYPSGHAALGWAWALVLSEVASDRADAILQRGHAFGQSRVICGAHWQSDVNAGRLVGSAAVAKQHANALFLAQVAAAKIEILQAREKFSKHAREPAFIAQCEAEAAAIANENMVEKNK
jgi:acid phosphatase (class A)